MRAPRFASLLALLLGLLVAGMTPSPGEARPGASTADPCRLAPTATLDPLSAYFASLDRAEMQDVNTGNTTCVVDLTAGTEREDTLRVLRATRLKHAGMTFRIRSIVATAYTRQSSTGLPDCATVQALVFQDVAYAPRGARGLPPLRHRTTVAYLYSLHDGAYRPAGPNQAPPSYVALDDHPVALGPVRGATGPFAASLAAAVNRYLLTGGRANQPLRPALMQALARNGFVIDRQSGQRNFFGVQGLQEYEDTYTQNIRSSIPSFVTLDAGLHTFHVLFDRTLMTAESVSLRPRLLVLLATLLQANASQRLRLTDPAAVAANSANGVYLAVAMQVLGGAVPAGAVPAGRAPVVGGETTLIQAHAVSAPSPFLGETLDYRLFTPRGHYTDGPELARYFEAMNWLALVQAPLEARHGVTPAAARAGALRAVLMAALMNGSGAGALRQWQALSDPITALIGTPAGPAMPDITALVRRVYGSASPPVATLQSAAQLTRFLALVPTLPAPPYRSTSSTGSLKVRGFGLFPARGIADGGLAAALTWPHVGTQAHPRTLPTGLDVLAALGSKRAQALARQTNAPGPGPWPGYDAALARAIPAFERALGAPSLYAHWLGALRPLAQPMPAAAPPVMQTTAWSDKELLTGLASWSELRHDSILYASQFGGLGAGGACALAPIFRAGYVEPIPAAWQALAVLADRLAGLTRAQGLFTGLTPGRRLALLAAEDQYRHGLRVFAAIAGAELQGGTPGSDQVLLVHHAYPVLGAPMSVFFTQTPHPVKDPDASQAAEIADVATDLQTGQVLEVGEGRVRDIWVLVPIGGLQWLTRGQVYTYYEFTTNGQRLSDQEWRQKIDAINPSAPILQPACIEALSR